MATIEPRIFSQDKLDTWRRVQIACTHAATKSQELDQKDISPHCRDPSHLQGQRHQHQLLRPPLSLRHLQAMFSLHSVHVIPSTSMQARPHNSPPE